jgi:hypothetical protein
MTSAQDADYQKKDIYVESTAEGHRFNAVAEIMWLRLSEAAQEL